MVANRPNTWSFVRHRVVLPELTRFSRIGEHSDSGWLGRGNLSGKATTSSSLMPSPCSPSGEARLARRESAGHPLLCSKPQTPQLATGEFALLCGRSDHHSNGQEIRSSNAALRDCPLHSQESCRFQNVSLGVECMYTRHCVRAAGNGRSSKRLFVLFIPLPAKSHCSYLIIHVISPGCTWTAASNAAHTA